MSRDFIENLFSMDKKQATKLIVYGIFLAIVFGAILAISVALDSNAGNWYNFVSRFNLLNYHNGNIGLNEYLQVDSEYRMIQYFMQMQDLVIANIARIGLNVGVLLVALGFLAYVMNDKLDPKMRLTALVVGGLLLFVMLMGLLGTFQVIIT